MEKRHFPYARGLAGIALVISGATAFSGPALAQTATAASTTFFGGGGGGFPPPGGSSTPGGQQPTDPGVRGGPADAGGPLAGLSANELAFFNAAKNVFSETEMVANGLGPRFNLDSCSGCHSQPATGGSSPATNPQVAVATAMGAKNTVPSFITIDGPIREARFIRNPDGTPDGGVHDVFVITGRSDAPGCNIVQPPFAQAIAANNIIFRIPQPLYGSGLLEAIPDSSLRAGVAANAATKRALGISGTFNLSGNDGTITRFGWKAQNKSLLLFAGEAYNVEEGITNDLFQTERDETPGCLFNNLPESTTNLVDNTNSGSLAADFSQDIVNFAAFMRMLAPPTPRIPGAATASTTTTQVAAATATSAMAAAAGTTSTATAAATTSTTVTAASVARGQQVFSNVGCVNCHAPNQTTGKTAMTGQSNLTFHPYSDMALHSMGTGLADGVTQGNANGNQFRTAPLWGVGQRVFFHHDGRNKDIPSAILAHSSPGSEANGVIQNYNMLGLSDKQALVNFLRSL